MSAYGEVEGTMTDQAGRIKRLSAAISPAGAALPGWEILCRIARAMGKPGFDYSSIEEISQEMENSTFDQVQEVDPPAWLYQTGEHDFLGADLSRWVAGMRMLSNERQEEGMHVHTA
jgi:NADH dehydrogenase/NADH:ubiquinone oxidoreductase subunit G